MNETQLPGGRIRGYTIPADRTQHTQARTRSHDHQDDHSLTRTAVRWTDQGWFIVTTDRAIADHKARTTLREGPFEDIEDLEARLQRLAHGGTVDNEGPRRGHDPTERIDTVIREGLTQRLLAATRAWIDAVDARGGNVRWEMSLHRFDERLAAGTYAEIDESFRRMRKAHEAYSRWLDR